MWRAAPTDSRARAAFAALQDTHAAGPHTSRASFEPHIAAEAIQQQWGTCKPAYPGSPAAEQHSSRAQAHSARVGLPPPPLPPSQQQGSQQQHQPSQEEPGHYEQWRAQHPCALTHLDDIRARLRGKRLAVFLDYDGTLTPIVSNPDEALLSQQMRDIVRSLARLYPTAIISGRGREKVENFVQLKELYYAGSHGMDIAGPTMMSNGAVGAQPDMAFQPAAHFRPMVDRVYHELCARLADIPGSSVEHNTFCVSAHFRNCSAERWQDVVAAVEEVVARNPELRMTRGRKVVEVRPKVNWHKGTALEHLLGALGLRHAPDVVSIYIGDDHTDEDAFKVLRDTRAGFGVLVSTKVRETAAAYTVRDPSEVGLLLQALVSWGSTAHNGWCASAASGAAGAGAVKAGSHAGPAQQWSGSAAPAHRDSATGQAAAHEAANGAGNGTSSRACSREGGGQCQALPPRGERPALLANGFGPSLSHDRLAPSSQQAVAAAAAARLQQQLAPATAATATS